MHFPSCTAPCCQGGRLILNLQQTCMDWNPCLYLLHGFVQVLRLLYVIALPSPSPRASMALGHGLQLGLSTDHKPLCIVSQIHIHQLTRVSIDTCTYHKHKIGFTATCGIPWFSNHHQVFEILLSQRGVHEFSWIFTGSVLAFLNTHAPLQYWDWFPRLITNKNTIHSMLTYPGPCHTSRQDPGRKEWQCTQWWYTANTWWYLKLLHGTWWVLHTTLSYVVLWCLQVHRATWDSKNLMVLEATPWYLMVFDEYFIPRCPMFSYVFLCHATMPFKWHSLGPWYKRIDAHLPHPFDQMFCAPQFLVNLGST